jgi:hypothetical protein
LRANYDAKIKIPENLKADLPQNKWVKSSRDAHRVTVIVTMLAGVVSNEMNRTRYDSSLAAQLQSKAGSIAGAPE